MAWGSCIYGERAYSIRHVRVPYDSSGNTLALVGSQFPSPLHMPNHGHQEGCLEPIKKVHALSLRFVEVKAPAG